MKILVIRSGLANQMLHYIFGRYLEEKLGNEEKVFHDLSQYNTYSPHNGFELDKVFPNIKLNLLCREFGENSKYYNDKTMGIVSNEKVCIEELSINDLLFVGSANDNLYIKNKNILVLDQDFMLKNNGKFLDNHCEHIFFHGCFFNKGFFLSIKDKIFHELSFLPIPDQINNRYLNLIQSTNSVGVHIRRGDFVKLGIAIEAEQYAREIKKLKLNMNMKFKKPTFFIFTNDFDWFKDNIKAHGFSSYDNLVLVEGNNIDSKNYIDMQLMTHCKYIVSHANSTFSRMGAWLNQDLIKHIEIRKN